MRKTEIIDKTLKEMNAREHAGFGKDSEYNEIIVAELNRRLPDGDIRTCEDFRHLNVTCCDTCHNFCPHYEMKLIDLPDGSLAWVCDPVEWAIYPERYEELQQWAKTSPEGKLLREIFGEDPDE